MATSTEFQLDPRTKAVFDRKGYAIKKRLASGAYGQVYTAERTSDQKMCAVKIMDLEKCSDKFQQKFLPRELAALIQMKHEYAIQIYDIFKSNKKIYIFMEYASKGTIADYLKKNGPLDEPFSCQWFTQVSEALNYMHSELGICHRDIKVDNILLDEKYIAKLTDFGFAKEGRDPETREVKMSKTFCGTEPYYSPQIIQKHEYNPFLADVWAMGVVLFAMLNNKFPFHFNKGKKIMLEEQLNHRYKLTKDFSKDLLHLQNKMFEPEEEKRYTMDRVLEHEWIKRKGKHSK